MQQATYLSVGSDTSNKKSSDSSCLIFSNIQILKDLICNNIDNIFKISEKLD